MVTISILEEYYNTLTLLVVLYGCKTWRLTLKEEHGLVVLETTVLRKTERGDFSGEDYVQRSCMVGVTKHLGGQIKRNEMGGVCGRYGGQERCLQGLMGRPERKALFERPRRRWEYNIKRDLEEVDKESWTRVFWLRIRTGGALL
jgi:hypothetical protein